jgi:hypothetical protein
MAYVIVECSLHTIRPMTQSLPQKKPGGQFRNSHGSEMDAERLRGGVGPQSCAFQRRASPIALRKLRSHIATAL